MSNAVFQENNSLNSNKWTIDDNYEQPLPPVVMEPTSYPSNTNLQINEFSLEIESDEPVNTTSKIEEISSSAKDNTIIDFIAAKPAPQQTAIFIRARVALCARKAYSNKEFQRIIRHRRFKNVKEQLQANIFIAKCLGAGGIVLGLLGAMVSFLFIKILAVTAVISGLVISAFIMNEISKINKKPASIFYKAGEIEAEEHEIKYIKQAAIEDSELADLIKDWWQNDDVLIRKQDITLVRDFVLLKSKIE